MPMRIGFGGEAIIWFVLILFVYYLKRDGELKVIDDCGKREGT